jgi:hypothetical protein
MNFLDVDESASQDAPAPGGNLYGPAPERENWLAAPLQTGIPSNCQASTPA